MNKDYYVFVFIPTYNCINKITPTIESVFNQTFDNKRLRIQQYFCQEIFFILNL
jgi:glycosyltransferase involved in cell wall biosynthesis